MAKPRERLVIEDSQIQLFLLSSQGKTTEYQRGTTVEQFAETFAAHTMAQTPMSFGLVPAGCVVRDLYQRHGIFVVLLEVAPSVRTVQWICDDSPADFGNAVQYRDAYLAFPWIYFFVALSPDGGVRPNNSVYFLKAQLRSLDEPLCDPHFYNCSVDAYGVWCWICGKGFVVGRTAEQPLFDLACNYVMRFWETGFNRSSERFEKQYGSFWTHNRQRIADDRVRTIKQWEAASKRDPEFVFSVPWVSAPRTARAVYTELTDQGSLWHPQSVRDLTEVLNVACTQQEEKKGEHS